METLRLLSTTQQVDPALFGEEYSDYRSCCHVRDTRQHDPRHDAGGAVHHRAAQQPRGTAHSVYLFLAGREHQP